MEESRSEIILREQEEYKKLFVFTDDAPKTVDLKIYLRERGSRAELVIVHVGRGANQTEMNITLVHEAADTYGRVIIKAALFDESRLVVRGMVDIKEGAKGADSYLLAKALLVSPKARAEMYPYLEINTDEIKASHGTSVGRIDERAMFYLQSHGIAQEQAQHIMLLEFFRDVAEDLPNEERKKLYTALESSLLNRKISRTA